MPSGPRSRVIGSTGQLWRRKWCLTSEVQRGIWKPVQLGDTTREKDHSCAINKSPVRGLDV